MSEVLGQLLALQRKLNTPALTAHPEVEGTRRLLQEKIEQSVTRIVPATMLTLEREHGWSDSFHKALEIYERFGLFAGTKKDKNALMSPKEMRDGVPGIGHVMEALKAHPELLAKVEQGFTRPHPVPFALPPMALSEGMSKAITQYHDEGKLRSSDGTKLRLDTAQPVWMWDAYEGADKNGSLVYFPERFDPKNHGGKTKKQILESSQFPGWMVLLIENLQRIPRQGKGQTVGGRSQIEANHSPHEYLAMQGSEQYAHEHGLVPEAWQSGFLTRIAETDGEVLDDYQDVDGAACYCTGGYFPSSGDVPYAYWFRDCEQALVAGDDPRDRNPRDGSRAGVRVL
ncbi:MAG: hypothetical protein Greene041619_746 [Candidatus Peregrinibacteria bacterium Greene0416_19]|nr:MAG: hypothetical protein Greene041619_746 [Candidatus Peregrinibacteria bacterium Greene0416_19]